MPRIPKNGAVRPDKDNAYGSKAYRQTDSDCHHASQLHDDSRSWNGGKVCALQILNAAYLQRGFSHPPCVQALKPVAYEI